MNKSIKPKKMLIVMSGGFDAVATYLHYKEINNETTEAIYIDFGSPESVSEKKVFEKYKIPVRIVKCDISAYSDLNGEIPCFEAITCSIALSCAYEHGFDAIAIGWIKNDQEYDDFTKIRAIEALGRGKLKVHQPFYEWYKYEVVKYMHKMGYDMSNTWSCWQGGDYHCGKCDSCLERIEAFKYAGVKDNTKYMWSVKK